MRTRSRARVVVFFPACSQADVYSFGVSVWEMVERRRPFEGLDSLHICALWISDPEQVGESWGAAGGLMMAAAVGGVVEARAGWWLLVWV